MNLVRLGFAVLACALALPLVLLGAYYLHGSLEEFPTPEQHSAARLVAGLGFVVLALAEAVLLRFLFRGRGRNRVAQELPRLRAGWSGRSPP